MAIVTHAHARPGNLGTRTPLPTEQERYLDMLLMVREAMREGAVWYTRVDNEMCRRLSEAGTLCLMHLDSTLNDDASEETASYIAVLASRLWIRYRGDKEAWSAASEAVAALNN